MSRRTRGIAIDTHPSKYFSWFSSRRDLEEFRRAEPHFLRNHRSCFRPLLPRPNRPRHRCHCPQLLPWLRPLLPRCCRRNRRSRPYFRRCRPCCHRYRRLPSHRYRPCPSVRFRPSHCCRKWRRCWRPGWRQMPRGPLVRDVVREAREANLRFRASGHRTGSARRSRERAADNWGRDVVVTWRNQGTPGLGDCDRGFFRNAASCYRHAKAWIFGGGYFGFRWLRLGR